MKVWSSFRRLLLHDRGCFFFGAAAGAHMGPSEKKHSTGSQKADMEKWKTFFLFFFFFLFWNCSLSVRPHQIENVRRETRRCAFGKPLELNATVSTAHAGRHRAGCSSEHKEGFTALLDTLTVTNREQIQDIRYVIGLTVYTVIIYSTKAILLSQWLHLLRCCEKVFRDRGSLVSDGFCNRCYGSMWDVLMCIFPKET